MINRFVSFFNKIKTESKTYFLAFIGCLVVLSIFYSRFIRHRLPQNIPFDLTELRFYAILCICISFIYIIKITIKPKNPHEYILNLRDYLSLPFSTLDNLVKTSRYSWLHMDQFLKSIYPKKYWTHMFLIIFLQLIPRIILVSVFLVDVFWFHKLYYFYVIIFFGIFPWSYSYHRYSMYHAKELGLVYLESFYDDVTVYEKGWADVENNYELDDDGNPKENRFEYDVYGNPINIDSEDAYEYDRWSGQRTWITKEWKPHPRNKYHEKTVTIREYLQILLEKDIDYVMNDYANDDDYDFDPSAHSKEYRYKQYKESTGKTKLKSADYEILNEEFNTIMPILSDLAFRLYYLPDKEKRYHMPKINLAIYILWFIAWSYILISSFHTLNSIPITMEILQSLLLYAENINPFINP